MNYNEAIEYIHSTYKFGSKLGLENIKRLLNLMDNPHEKLRVIHIAGTNGKGSTTAMIANVLHKAGYKTGMYTSPYIEFFNERIRINGEMITDNSIASLVNEIKEYVEIIVKDGHQHPTEFEIITALAFLYFYRQNCDYVVLEVGLGGRMDATNVATPLVSVITSISYDHMEYLGNTLSEISYEKCGIIKDNVPVVVYPIQKGETIEVIKQVCKDRKTTYTVASIPKDINATIFGNTFTIEGFGEIKTSLAGEYQAYNASTALATLLVIRNLGVAISDYAIIEGIKTTSWSGRFELVCEKPITILDGGHNVSGVVELRKALENVLGQRKLTIVMGMLKDKQYEECIELLANISTIFIATKVPNVRTAEASEIADIAKKYCKNTFLCDDYEKAVAMAFEMTDKKDAICITGSLYLIGEVRKSLDIGK